MKCSDIPDRPILEFLLVKKGRWCFWGGPVDQPGKPGYEHNIERAMPSGLPWKLVHAKMRRLIARGLVSGCACGCRGDFEITPKGESLLLKLREAAQPVTIQPLCHTPPANSSPEKSE
jgi:hypothetical protein